MVVEKEFLSYSDQVNLLRKRGLSIDDQDECEKFLSRVNYYRLSGYFRYWQEDPRNGDNRFMKGSSFVTIHGLYIAEEEFKVACFLLLQSLEVLVRTRFAYYYAHRVSPKGFLPKALDSRSYRRRRRGVQ
ncbi:Abi family protein [Canibacter zhuwentaonis]|uniref:Abi family protein n=1 Tax=Canibacter zhuwentaonis TaxID=2837491 RepID=UPI002028D084|nr:Abi family protein [Canibacter zhuwentaonis]